MSSEIFNINENEPIANINVTPFVDIILVVLIIFMVTTPMIVKPSLEVQLPKAVSSYDSHPSPLTITLNQEGQIDLNGQAITQEQLPQRVRAISQSNPELQAVISADKDVAHGHVITIIDIVRNAGINKFAITTSQ